MAPINASSRFLSRGLVFVAFPVALTVIYAAQLVLAGNVSWGRALWQETIYWTSWTLTAIGIFGLCRWLHAGPRHWQRLSLGFFCGAIAVVIVHPLAFQSLRFGAGWLGWQLGFATEPPTAFLPALRRSTINLIGPSILLYTGTVLAWHVVTYYRDLKERQLKSVELESMLRQAQLQALRSQLNPHFLFNTLHSVAELVHEDPRRAEQMLLRLADLLRKALRSSGALEVGLAEELDFVKGYLEIEQMRLGERLRVTWDIARDALPARVPSLLLQPLVENAIRHGIAPSTQAGTLLIRAWRENGFLHLQVRDNGPGLSEPANGHDAAGLGLANTRHRLQRLYGEQYRFELINDHGLSVNVRFSFATAPSSHADAH